MFRIRAEAHSYDYKNNPFWFRITLEIYLVFLPLIRLQKLDMGKFKSV